MNYTKGEWTSIDFKDTLDLFEHGHFQIVGNNQRANVAIIPAHWNNAEANAHLIAAAPDMYVACKEMLFELKQTKGISMRWLEKWEKALAKAEGRI